jgi:hypothetical protein
MFKSLARLLLVHYGALSVEAGLSASILLIEEALWADHDVVAKFEG